MPHHIQLEDHGTGIVISLTGIITGRDLIKLNQQIYESDPDKKLRYQVWDFNLVDVLEMKTDDIQTLAIQDMEEASANPNQCVAIIGSTKTLRGIDNIYHYLSDCLVNTGFQSKSFTSMDEAREWLATRRATTMQKCV